MPQDYAEALTWYRRAAEQGHADAQYEIGHLYHNGHGVSQSYAEAAQWYRRAAEQGHAKAQFLLGLMYHYGHGVPQNDAEALRWYRRAAEQGHAPAQILLGALYAHGQGVPQDYVRAQAWLNLAAARLPSGPDRDLAVRTRDTVAKRMTPAQLASAQEIARTWQPREERSTKPVETKVATALPPQTPPAPQRRDLIR